MDHFADSSIYAIPMIAFIIGITGGLHCITMCGAIATTCSSNLTNNLSYQVGRITSYSLLGILAGLMGQSFKSLTENPYLKSTPAIMLGLFFIYWGISTLTGKKASIPMPKKVVTFIQNKLGLVYRKQEGFIRSLSIGMLTALLPCGLLYGVLFSLTIFQNPVIGMVGMFFFALGTIPPMTFSPVIIRKILGPLQSQYPKITSMGLISFGLVTISYRIYISYGQAAICH